MINVTTATTRELVDFYNEHAERPVKKFANRATAERRVQAMIDELYPKADDEKRAEAQRRAWANPEVKAARSRRQHVKVDGVTYRSVKQAFEQLNLPLTKHIKFRGELKALGHVEAFGHNWMIVDAG